MNGLKRCPCGKIPQELNIMCDAYYGFAVATCDHCCHWSVLVHEKGHTDADTEKNAIKCWNDMPIKGGKCSS